MQNEIRSHGIYAGEKSNSFFTLCFLTPMEMTQPHLTENLKIGRFLRIQTPPLLTLCNVKKVSPVQPLVHIVRSTKRWFDQRLVDLYTL